MSFIKSMKCFFCSREQTLQEVNFPESVFDLITLSRIVQLFWLCESCKKTHDRNPSLLAPHLLSKGKAICAEKFDGKNLSDTESTGSEKNHLLNNNNKQEALNDDDDLGTDTLSKELKKLSISRSSKYGNKSIKYAQKVLNVIKVDQNEKSVCNLIVNSVLESLLNTLQENEEFSYMYNRPVYTGSAYNRLRIKDATEFDIDLVLKAPKIIQLKPEFDDEIYSFAKLKWELVNDDGSNLAVNFFKSSSTDGYLQPKKVLSWFQHHLDLIKEKLPLPVNVQSVKFFESGPARTVIIETTLGYSINVDLVPVFEFEYSTLKGLSLYSEIMKTAEGNNNDKWLLVPKEMSGEGTKVLSSDTKFYWRLDFPNSEKQILSGKECANNVIKILKIFRDKNDWKALASYYLKMIVILAIIDHPEKEYWSNANLFDRLIESLKQLESCLEKKTILHFLTKQNLLTKFNSDQCTNWRNRLQTFIYSLEQSPDTLISHLEVSE